MATTLAMLESKATTAEKLILMLRQQIGEARAAQVILSARVFNKTYAPCVFLNYREDCRRLLI